MRPVIRTILFLILNFTALAMGGLFTGAGVASDWYRQMDKAPWTPPGWVFGAAWTLIMTLFAVYMASAWGKVENRKALGALYGFQWILNVMWNPVFFYFHNAGAGLVIIVLLTALVAIITVAYWTRLKGWSVLILPYFFWLLIATSLNGYICLNN